MPLLRKELNNATNEALCWFLKDNSNGKVKEEGQGSKSL